LLRGGSSHENVKRGSRRGSDGRKIAGPRGPDGRGACRQMISCGRKTAGQGLPIRLCKQGDGKPTGSGNAPVIRRFARSADSRERTRTNRRTSNLAGRRVAQAAKFSRADGGLTLTEMPGKGPGSDTQRSSLRANGGALLGSRESGIRWSLRFWKRNHLWIGHATNRCRNL
jgi:hypothetical protein